MIQVVIVVMLTLLLFGCAPRKSVLSEQEIDKQISAQLTKIKVTRPHLYKHKAKIITDGLAPVFPVDK